MVKKKFRNPVRMSIGTKLIALLAVVLVGSIAAVVGIATHIFTSDNTALIQKMNADAAASLATQQRLYFENLLQKSGWGGRLLLQPSPSADAVEDFFEKDKSLAFVSLLKSDNQKLEVVANMAAPRYSKVAAQVEAFAKSAQDLFSPELAKIAQSQGIFKTVKGLQGELFVALALPLVKNGNSFSHYVVSFVQHEALVKILSQFETMNSYLVDRRGFAVVHTDSSKVLLRENLAQLPIVAKVVEGKVNNFQLRFQNPRDGQWYLGAFQNVGFAGLAVVTEVPELLALAASERVQYRSMLVAVAVLSLSFMMGYWYSGTLTWPIQQLSAAASKIAGGNFNVKLSTKGNDELTHLSIAFNQMAVDLEHREKVVATFHKFHNKEIADKLLSGEVKLGGERKQAVIFFSDLRGFTAMSEKMQPEEVVELLNSYLTRIVAIIRRHQGVVDKFIGDAIMALWGVPMENENDAVNALNACLEIRRELARFNEERALKGLAPLRMGIGLHCGPVIAGNIGSSEKMEYTVIGDTVNLASRIESLTKEYGVDLLVSKAVVDRVAERYIWEQAKAAKVKGKSSSVEIYKVRGIKNADGSAEIVQTPYSEYAQEKSEKSLTPELPELVDTAPPTPTTQEAKPDVPVANLIEPSFENFSDQEQTHSNILLNSVLFDEVPAEEWVVKNGNTEQSYSAEKLLDEVKARKLKSPLCLRHRAHDNWSLLIFEEGNELTVARFLGLEIEESAA